MVSRTNSPRDHCKVEVEAEPKVAPEEAARVETKTKTEVEATVSREAAGAVFRCSEVQVVEDRVDCHASVGIAGAMDTFREIVPPR